MGLAGATGLNLHLPLFILGMIDRFSNVIDLQEPYSFLSHPWTLVALGVLVVIEFLADKVPAVDHAWHAIGMVLQPVAGAFVFLATTQGKVDPVAAAIMGLVISGTVHTARATVRPVSTATTAGTANPVISLVEDTGSAGLSFAALFVPVVAGIAVGCLLVGTVWAAVRFRRKLKRKSPTNPKT